MAQWVKTPATEPDNMDLTPRTYSEGEHQLPKLTSDHPQWHAYAYVCAQFF